MKPHKLLKTQQSVIAHRPISSGGIKQNEANFTPSPDEVARKAYLNYENERSQPGHDIQHWLKAEADLIAEHNLTGVPGFYNRT